MKIKDVYSDPSEDLAAIDEIIANAEEWPNIDFESPSDGDDVHNANDDSDNESKSSTDLVMAETPNNGDVQPQNGLQESPLDIVDEVNGDMLDGMDYIEEVEGDDETDTEEPHFEPNQLVWAKLRYCPYWPARVIERPTELLDRAPDKVSVLFFGSRCIGLVSRRNIVDYRANRTKYAKRSFNTYFPYAVRQMDEYIQDPMAHGSNSCIEDNNSIITVKKECEPFIKVEKDLDDYPCDLECVRRTDPTSLLALTESRRLKLDRKNRELQQTIIQLTYNNTQLAEAHAKLGTENVKLKAKLYDLEKENRDLMSGHKSVLRSMGLDSDDQLPTTSRGAARKKVKGPGRPLANRSRAKKRPMRLVDDDDDDTDSCFSERAIKQELMDDDVIGGKVEEEEEEETEVEDNPVCILATGEKQYEVERIIKHRTWSKELWFLIRWKGYSAKHDDWIKKTDLDCPELLDEYMAAKSLSTKPKAKRRKYN